MFKRLVSTLFFVAILVGVANATVPTCTVSGTVNDGAGNAVANGVITFNTLYTQVVSSNTINQTLISTTTNSSGSLTPISLAQGVYVQITINGGAPVTAIVPFSTSVSFSSLISNVVTNPVTTSIDITGGTAPTCDATGGVIYEDSSTHLMYINNYCSTYYVIPLTSSTTATDDAVLVGDGTKYVNEVVPNCLDAGGNHLNYTAATNTFSCGNTSSGGGGVNNNPFSDATALVKNNADNTKQLIISAASITTATTRTLTAPDRNATIATSSGTLTNGNLVKFDASGNVVDDGIAIASLSGNTTKAGTVSGSLTSGNLIKSDASGNLIDAGFVATAVKSPIAGAEQNLSASSTGYMPAIGYSQGGSTTEGNNDTIMAVAGTIKNMYCGTAAAPGTAKQYVFTYRKNAASQTLTCTISGNASTSCNDTTHTFTVAVGDLVSVQIAPSGTPTSTTGYCGAELDPS